jgi:hypothetical protein
VGDRAWLSMGDGYAMTVVDYIAISVLIGGLVYAVTLALRK